MRLRRRSESKKKIAFIFPGPQLNPKAHITNACDPDSAGFNSEHMTEKILPSSLSDRLRRDVFPTNAPKAAVHSTVPEQPRSRVTSTLQLAFCARLLTEDHTVSTSQSSITQHPVLDEAGRNWLDVIREDPSAQAHIHWLVSRLATEFIKDPSLGFDAISEVVVLGPVLGQADYRKLLSCFIERFDRAFLLNEALLQGMIQLLQSAPTGFIAVDDLVRIVESIRKRLESNYVPSKDHVYQLVVTLTKVLEVMVGREVKGLSRQRFHQPLVAALRSLKGVHDDEFIKFHVNYAYQTSLSLPDDETSFQAFLRYAKSLAVGISAVASVFKLDPKYAFDAMKHLLQLVRNAFDVVKFNNDGTQAFKATVNEATQAAEKAYPSRKKEPWFRILQRAHGFVREGRLVDFNQLICDTACLFELDFRRGISLILGELAIDPLWDIQNRRRAIDFLGDICRDDFKQGQKGKIASWITSILSQISVMDLPNISVLACSLLHDLGQEQPIDAKHFYPLLALLPLSTSSPLLDKTLDISCVEYTLDSLRLQRLKECLRFHSIPLHAAKNSLAPNDKLSPLMRRAGEFLDSERLVFLLLGDSGSGKSTFCKQLERELWIHYKKGDRIPLLVDLSSIEHPENDLIEKHLQQHNFSDVLIQKLKYQRRFVLICDGYDELRLTKNLHTTNRFNRRGQWDIKMFITCRNTFLSKDYQGRFHPQGADRYHDVDFELFEEATVAPFSQSDIRKFVEQSIHNPDERTFSNDQAASSVSECMERLSTIPNMIGLVTNPFLLTLALKALLFLPIDAFEPSVIITTRLQLYDRFVRSWIQLGKKRLERAPLNQETFTVFEHLLQDNFTECAIEFLKRLAEAIFEHQSGRPTVEYSHRKDKGSWKARFFGDQIEPTLLREASPLTRAGIRHWFIHTSLLEYFYSLTFYDPNDGGTGQPPGGGGGSSYGSSYGSTDGGRGSSSSNGGLADSSGDSTGGNGSNGGSDGTTGGDSGHPSGNNNHSSGSGESPGDNPGNPSDGRDSRYIKSGSGGNEDGSGDDDEDDSDEDDDDDSDKDEDDSDDDGEDDSDDDGEDDSDDDGEDDSYDDGEDDSDDDGEDDSYDDGDFSDRDTCGVSGSKDGAYQRKNNSPHSNDITHLDGDILRRSDKGPVADSQPSTSTDPFSRKNLFNEPAVLQFLVERAQLDERLKERLETTIMQSKSSKIPSLAAANALLILLRAGERFSDVELQGVLIPGDYLAKSNVHSHLLATLNTSTTGMGLLKAVSICFNLRIVQTLPIKPQSKRSLLKRPVFSGEQTGAMATHSVKPKPLTKDQRSREYGQRSNHSRAPIGKRFFQLDSHESLGDLESEKSSSDLASDKSSSDLDSDESFSDLEWYSSDASSGNTRTPLHRHNLASNPHKDHNSALSKDNWPTSINRASIGGNDREDGNIEDDDDDLDSENAFFMANPPTRIRSPQSPHPDNHDLNIKTPLDQFEAQKFNWPTPIVITDKHPQDHVRQQHLQRLLELQQEQLLKLNALVERYRVTYLRPQSPHSPVLSEKRLSTRLSYFGVDDELEFDEEELTSEEIRRLELKGDERLQDVPLEEGPFRDQGEIEEGDVELQRLEVNRHHSGPFAHQDIDTSYSVRNIFDDPNAVFEADFEVASIIIRSGSINLLSDSLELPDEQQERLLDKGKETASSIRDSDSFLGLPQLTRVSTDDLRAGFSYRDSNSTSALSSTVCERYSDSIFDGAFTDYSGDFGSTSGSGSGGGGKGEGSSTGTGSGSGSAVAVVPLELGKEEQPKRIQSEQTDLEHQREREQNEILLKAIAQVKAQYAEKYRQIHEDLANLQLDLE